MLREEWGGATGGGSARLVVTRSRSVPMNCPKTGFSKVRTAFREVASYLWC